MPSSDGIVSREDSTLSRRPWATVVMIRHDRSWAIFGTFFWWICQEFNYWVTPGLMLMVWIHKAVCHSACLPCRMLWNRYWNVMYRIHCERGVRTANSRGRLSVACSALRLIKPLSPQLIQLEPWHSGQHGLFRVHELKLTAAALWMQLNTGFIGYLFDAQKPKRPKSKYREVLWFLGCDDSVCEDGKTAAVQM